MRKSYVLTRRNETLIYSAAGFIATLVVLFVLAELHRHVAFPLIEHYDKVLQAFIHSWASPRLTPVMLALTWIGSPTCVIPLCALIAAALWLAGNRRQSALLLCSMLGAAVLVLALKAHFKRIRPDVSWSLVTEHSYSFPSGHSMMAVVLYGMLLYLFLRLLDTWTLRIAATLAAFTLAAGIGISRVYLGAHFPSDVAAGYFCGSIWLLTLVAADLIVRRELQHLVVQARAHLQFKAGR